jgi:hypothetical protein
LSEKKPEVSEDLRELVRATLESIREGIKGKDCGVEGSIDFEVAVIKSKEGKAGFRFLIADASGNYSSEKVSKIRFKVTGKKNSRGINTGVWLDK